MVLEVRQTCFPVCCWFDVWRHWKSVVSVCQAEADMQFWRIEKIQYFKTLETLHIQLLKKKIKKTVFRTSTCLCVNDNGTCLLNDKIIWGVVNTSYHNLIFLSWHFRKTFLFIFY